MLKYFLIRLLSIIPMAIIISIIIFAGLQMTPGDPVRFNISPEQLANMKGDLGAVKEALGLNAPVYVLYFKWINNLLHGDFGYSLVNGTPISYMLRGYLPASIELMSFALLISSVLGISFGLLASVKQNSVIDYVNTSFSVFGISIPDFFVGIIAILIFGLKLQWLPIGGRLEYGKEAFLERFPHMIMPALVLGFALTAVLMRLTRASMIDVLNKDYIKTARSKGLPEWKVIIKHAFRNALLPVILLLTFRLTMLIGGSVIIETVFNYPGIGKLILDAISAKDIPVVMITSMMIAIVVLIASFLVDMLNALIDPRIRF
ncbi:MAG: ABC transporter permease [Bacteroidales bacterium]|nr:ABC transporter permease [Bacteroidales bacterium]